MHLSCQNLALPDIVLESQETHGDRKKQRLRALSQELMGVSLFSFSVEQSSQMQEQRI